MSALATLPARIRAAAGHLAPYLTVALAGAVYVVMLAAADTGDRTGYTPAAVPVAVDPCVFGEPADETVRDRYGNPVPPLPCPLAVQTGSTGTGH